MKKIAIELLNIAKELIAAKWKKKISDSDIKKYGIPDWALDYDGRNAPEAAQFVSRSDGAQKVGQIVKSFNGEKLVVIYDLGGEFLATGAHSL